MTVLLALTFILAISNLNGVNTSFADTEDNTTQTTTEQSNSEDSTTSDDSATDDSTTTEESTQDSEKDENTLTTKDGFKYILEEDEVTIKGYEGKESDLEIPSKIDGHKVTKIGENAFDGNEEIINVTIPDSVKTIDLYAFYILRPQLIRKGIEFVSQYREIYTTRLHVFILSILLGKSCTIIDNSYGKNSSFYETWLKNVDGIILHK